MAIFLATLLNYAHKTLKRFYALLSYKSLKPLLNVIFMSTVSSS